MQANTWTVPSHLIIVHTLCFTYECVKLTGRGVFTKTDVLQGQFLAQYVGELISEDEGDRREAIAETGFRFFFQHHRSHYWYIESCKMADFAHTQ